MERNLFQQFADGALSSAGKHIDVAQCPWNAHPSFAGVFLKNVVTAEQTHGLFTCHLVRIEPRHSIGRHVHPGSIELHEVMEGSGVCLTEQGEIPYAPGVVGILEHNSPHEVRAGAEGLCLLAKFITVPA